MAPTVSGTVTDKSGNSTTWSVDFTVSGASVLLPGQVAGKVVVGMATDDYDARVAELGRAIGADHFFVPSWSVSQFIAKAQEAHDRGCLPYGNMKVGSWATAAAGGMDAAATQLGNAIAALGYPVRVVFAHEPGMQTPNGTGDDGTGYEWRAMNMRLLPRVKAAAPNAVVGVCDNGFKWSPNTNGQGWTFAEIDQLYTDEFLACMDVVGADYYDGATTRTNGEPAWLKVQRADQWANTRGVARMDIGEWNFVRPADCDSMTSFLTSHTDRWWCANAFNSDLNNRANIPTIGGGWGFNHGYDTTWDRRDAFRRMVDHPVTSP